MNTHVMVDLPITGYNTYTDYDVFMLAQLLAGILQRDVDLTSPRGNLSGTLQLIMGI
jgi:hypothetical protein